jgi:deferrochelatase/peroxidase EfeB
MSLPAPGVSRRRLLGMTGAGLLAGAATGAGVSLAVATPEQPGTAAVPFHGRHQAGIATPVQDRLHFAAFDVLTDSPAQLAALLRAWTAVAERLTRGAEVGTGALGGPAAAPPDDTGEALGLPASRLTLTIGFAPSLFDARFGLAARRPPELAELPAFPGDALDPARSRGDIAVQACADDPQVAFHAIRTLTRVGFGRVAIRWSQLGFGKTSSTTPESQTPRNLFGFKDGTNNPAAGDLEALDRHVWVDRAQGPEEMAGGSYLVARRIRMQMETWDRESLHRQETLVGRTKGEGAPLGSEKERDPVDPARLPPQSHVALMHPSANAGATILRRGYSFADGSDGLGRLDAGLFFLAYQRDPRTQLVPLLAKMARHDALHEYLRHTGSGIWACPPGVREGGWWGEELFG